MNYTSNRTLLLTAAIAALFHANVGLAASAPARSIIVDHGAQDPSVSPDGSQIAVSILGKLWLVPAQGGDGRQITNGTGWDTHPAWSDDGRFLAYAHALPGESDLAVLNLETGNVDLVTRTDGQIGQIKYARDGAALFFVLRKADDAHIEKVALTGGKIEPITESAGWHEWSFALSPDGNALLVASGRHGGSNLYRIRLRDREGTRLTNTIAAQGQLAWAHDDRYLYVETLNGVETVYSQPIPKGEREALYSSPYRDTAIALDPDSSSAVLCAARRLYRLTLKSGRLTPIPFRARIDPPLRSPGDLVITHARLIGGTFESALTDATIEIRAGRIVGIHSGDSFVATAHVPVIDAGGKTLLPGLMDNHFHFLEPFMGAALLSRGITAVRDPGGELANSMSYKEAIHFGWLTGPDIYAAGPLIDGIGSYHPWVAVEIDDAAKAAALVASLHEQGVDLIKVYFLLKPEVLCAVITAAHEHGLKVTGHIGVRTSWAQALDCGIDGLNHVRVWADLLPQDQQPQGENDSLDAELHPVARMQADWRQIDPQGPAVDSLIAHMARRRIGFDPTLSVQAVDDAARVQLSLEDFALWRDSSVRMGAFAARAVQAGVLLLAGTDNGNLFDELEAYERAGIPRATILRAATINGAQWLGLENEFGVLELNRRADLIIVDGDPLTHISDLRRIRAVIKDGRVVFENGTEPRASTPPLPLQ